MNYKLVLTKTDLNKNHSIYTTTKGEMINVVNLSALILNKDTDKFSINKNNGWSITADTDVLIPHDVHIVSDESIRIADCYITDGEEVIFANYTNLSNRNIRDNSVWKVIVASNNKMITFKETGVKPIQNFFIEELISPLNNGDEIKIDSLDVIK